MKSEPKKKPETIYDFTVKKAKGNDDALSIYKGKVLLIVNGASQWYSICSLFFKLGLSDLTNSNYPELNQLYEKYKDQGFDILAFPCNQFHKQETGSNEQIIEFVCTHFNRDSILEIIFSGTFASFWLTRMAKLLNVITPTPLHLALR
ncbi:Glutathione peroxidase [Parasponia andersonii]|uniref:Glutathione peroxidase n=1 Tax=Parasponia andersonii TaxID=3476 RepID=A0A2P5CP86_PARAD|nr:Glutathione peroxidase [Parasponia andersonii]